MKTHTQNQLSQAVKAAFKAVQINVDAGDVTLFCHLVRTRQPLGMYRNPAKKPTSAKEIKRKLSTLKDALAAVRKDPDTRDLLNRELADLYPPPRYAALEYSPLMQSRRTGYCRVSPTPETRSAMEVNAPPVPNTRRAYLERCVYMEDHLAAGEWEDVDAAELCQRLQEAATGAPQRCRAPHDKTPHDLVRIVETIARQYRRAFKIAPSPRKSEPFLAVIEAVLKLCRASTAPTPRKMERAALARIVRRIAT